MAIKFFDTEEDRGSGSDLVGRFLAKQFIADLEKKEDEAKKAKEKKKPEPMKVSVTQLVFILMACSPFVTMAMTTVLLTAYVNWATTMKALVHQLP